MSESKSSRHWTAVTIDAPALSNRQWWAVSFIGAIFLLAALLQIISFNDFSDNLTAMGIGSANVWAAVLILAELWAAVGFFKIRLSRLFRKTSNLLSVGVAGFWFYQSIRAVSEGAGAQFSINGQSNTVSADFFGRFLAQQPGWWTVTESVLFLILVLWAIDISNGGTTKQVPVATKTTIRNKRGRRA